MLFDKSAIIRGYAVESLTKKYGFLSLNAIHMLNDKVPFVREKATQIISHIEPNMALTLFKKHLKDDAPTVRAAILREYSKINDKNRIFLPDVHRDPRK